MSDLARLETQVHDAVLRATVVGEIDMSNALDLEATLLDLAAGQRGLVMDLTQVTFMDSAGVRLLDHLVEERGPDAPIRVVARPDGPVRFALRVCGFRDDLLADDVDKAMADLADL